jgi:hypothetical protein
MLGVQSRPSVGCREQARGQLAARARHRAARVGEPYAPPPLTFRFDDGGEA